jgi:hypothetical protein
MSSSILLIRDMVVDGGTDDLAVKPYILQFVANALRDNMGVIIFDL